MNRDENNILVQKYLGNEFSKAERTEFEKELKSNIDLLIELDLQQNVESAIKDNTLEVFKARLQSIHKEILGNQNRYRLFSSKTISLMAASIVLIFTFGSLIFYSMSESKTTTDIFNHYYEPYEISTTTRTALTSVDSNLDKATKYYTNLEYHNAKLILKDLKLAEGDNSQILMMLGISNLELDLLEEAKDNFITIIEAKDPFYCQQAEWYLAFSYLKAKDKEKAILHLESIISKNRYYTEKAQQVLSSLE